MGVRPKGTTTSSGWDFGFLGWEVGFPVDAEDLVDTFLFLFRLAGFADVDRASVGARKPGGNDLGRAK